MFSRNGRPIAQFDSSDRTRTIISFYYYVSVNFRSLPRVKCGFEWIENSILCLNNPKKITEFFFFEFFERSTTRIRRGDSKYFVRHVFATRLLDSSNSTVAGKKTTTVWKGSTKFGAEQKNKKKKKRFFIWFPCSCQHVWQPAINHWFCNIFYFSFKWFS